MLIRNDYKPYMVCEEKKTAAVVRNSGGRLAVLTAVIGMAFVFLVAYGVFSQIRNSAILSKESDERLIRSIKEPALRGMITDRNGAVLAVSRHIKMPTFNPKKIYEPKRKGDEINWNVISDAQFTKLAALLKLPESEVRAKLQDLDSTYVNFKTKLTLEEADTLMALKIPSLRFEESTERSYPTGRLFSHIVGFANSNGVGLEGLEKLQNKPLTGFDGKQIVLRDRYQNVIELLDSPENVSAQSGQTLVLSVDEAMQRLANEELGKALQHFQAKAGGVVVLDAQTGEILAMSSFPDYDANYYPAFEAETWKNFAVASTMEPGSIIKPFIVAKALDDGKINANTLFDTRPYSIGKKIIQDTHFYPNLDAQGILQKSSNVGVSKIAAMYDNQQMYDYYSNVGVGRKTQSGVGGEQYVALAPAHKWGKLDKAVMSYGYAIGVNLLQMAQAYTIFTADGQLMPATIFKQYGQAQGTLVIKPETARLMRRLMVSVTQKGGTGQSGAIEGYDVAGKTGTARKSINGKYVEGKYTASFVGFAPAEAPRLIVAVSIDEPSGKGFYGGTVAGPVFREVMSGGLKLLGVKPTHTSDSTINKS
ncbi:MAG: penicillin-binding protein 2 [Alysiella sp.]|uniref:peptidoglycan D,D-transpeptidase FtsI family protein n=1 Tax=Alysiella sp. TaxID=1872483 RepID=UPI0026DB28B9|nr:penicillin-binding protein 2 [Alysiella sp.]MDO4434561.1 penicillin-binding protein 2 [Alysiella sp.]